MMRKLYMVTTKDKYELPIFVGDSTSEVAKVLGRHQPSVYNGFYYHLSTYHIVEVDDDDTDFE